MTVCNLFFVSTPVQLVFAHLVAEHVGGGEYIIATDYQPSVVQIERVAAVFGITTKNLIPSSHRRGQRFKITVNEFRRFLATIMMRLRLGPRDTVYLGNVQHESNRPLVFGLEEARLRFFDDGAATIPLLQNRAAGQTKVSLRRGSSSAWYTRLYPRFARFHRLTYYTIYPGLVGGCGDTVFTVPPALPACAVRTKRSVSEVWMIGGPVVTTGVIGEQRYQEMLSHLAGCCVRDGLTLVYFPHRSERISAALVGVEMRRPELPFEIAYALGTKRPAAIVSIISSVILNIKLMFGNEVPLAYIDPERGHSSEKVAPIQSYAARHVGIPCLDFDGVACFLRSVVARGELDRVDGQAFRGEGVR